MRAMGRQLLPGPDLHGVAILHYQVSGNNPSEKALTCIDHKFLAAGIPLASKGSGFDCRAFCALIDGKRSMIKDRPKALSLASLNAKEVLRHAG